MSVILPNPVRYPLPVLVEVRELELVEILLLLLFEIGREESESEDFKIEFEDEFDETFIEFTTNKFEKRRMTIINRNFEYCLFSRFLFPIRNNPA